MNRIVLSPAYPANPGTAWYPFIATEMGKAGFDVIIPQLPDPDLSEWQKIIKPLADRSPKQTILIGHSIGGINILRYLESTETSEKFPLLVLVAPPGFSLGYEVLESFFKDDFDYNKIKSKVEKIVVIITLQDSILAPDPMKHGRVYLDNLNAKLIVLREGGHFADFDNVLSLQEVIDEITIVENNK
jgi:uncharacterized protein